VKSGNPRTRASATDWTGKTLFGKWTVERLIGVGGTATVLQARHRNGRRAALKVLHPHLAAHGRTRERFLREGRLANLVNHPGVVAVLDDFMTDDGTAVLVLELVQGQTLAALAKASGGILQPGEVVAAACAMLDILAVAHDANVIHRDIKPENILRRADGSHKLADFGLAALHHELGMLTGTNMALGTPAYMSPEQARGDALHVDARTDIWGLGATMYTLLTGRYLHATSAPKNLVVAAATEPAPAILSLEPDMHPPLAGIIDRAVRMDKEDRWPNARAMLAELKSIDLPVSEIRAVHPASLEGTTLPTAPTSLMSWSRGATWFRRAEARSKRRLVGSLLGAGLAVAGTTVWWTWPSTTPRAASAPASEAERTTAARESTGPAPAVIPPAPTRRQEPPAAELARPPTPTARARDANARGWRAPVPSAVPSSASPVPLPNEVERATGVPDEVLDRRE
jgi:eukaryotic-like serine/threonine-protein kinase